MRSLLCVSSMAVLAAAPGAATALEADARVFGLLIGHLERDRPAQPYDLDPVETFNGRGPTLSGTDGYLEPTLDDEAAFLLLGADVEARLHAAVRAQLAVDTGLLTVDEGRVESDGRSLGESARASAFLRTAWIEVAEPESAAFGLGLGRRLVRLGEGLLLDEYATGIEAFGGVGEWTLTAGAWVPGRDLEPDGEALFVGELAWAFDFMSRVAVFGVVQRADDATAPALVEDAVYDERVEGPSLLDAPTIRRLYCSDLSGETSPWWLGATAEVVLEGHTLRGAFVAGFGETTFDLRVDRERTDAIGRLVCRDPRLEDRHVEVDLRGFAADVTWRARAGEKVWLGAFGLYQSGGRLDTDTDTYTSFLAIRPYFERPAVFFDAGLAAAFEPRVHPPAGVAGRGVIAAGPTVLFAPVEWLELSGLAALLVADEDGPLSPSRAYGEEVDVRALARSDEGLSFTAEAGAWRLGEFFPEDGVVWQARAGLRAEWPP